MLVPLNLVPAHLVKVFDLDLADSPETTMASSSDPTTAFSAGVLDGIAWFLFLANPCMTLEHILAVVD
eukprot:10378224-Ditylum_brightwellii.AAC.1